MLGKIGSGKATGPLVVSIEMITASGEIAINVMTKLFQDVLKELSDYRVELEMELRLKDVLRSATITSGALCAMISGMLLMLKWCADSWDSPLPVLDHY